MFKQDKNTDKIVVLGKEFNSEEERREHFRNELRKHLPELKKMEGFPFGEDEDIIKLSDPPYYTACPNPWLNDFIAEWEEEKKQLEKEGKRVANFEVDEPYAYDISVGKNNPIYNAHGYHTKVPHLAILRYIMHYTQPGDIIYDGFAGTGMTAVACSECDNLSNEHRILIESEFRNNKFEFTKWGKRNSLIGELSPIASFIGYNYNSYQNSQKLHEEANGILQEVMSEFNWMYETAHDNNVQGLINYVVWSDVFLCPECNHELIYWEKAVDVKNGKLRNEFECSNCNISLNKRKLVKSWQTVYDSRLDKTIERTNAAPVLINYTVGKKRFEKVPDSNDLKLIEKIKHSNGNYWVATDELPIGYNTLQPKRSHGASNAHHFFTERNLQIIGALWEKSRHNSHLMWIITGILQRASIQHQIAISRVGGEKANAGGKTAGHRRGTLYIPSNQVEFNVFTLYKERLRPVVKSLINKKKSDVLIETASCTNSSISDNSIDYIFIDPPFGANIMYSELNYIWESWLKVKTNNIPEAIENNVQKKGLFEYSNLMTNSFLEYYRVLKPGKWMTIEFSNTSAAVWNSIQNSIQRAGFIISNVAALDKKQQTHSARISPTAVKQDLVITCYKSSSLFNEKFEIQKNEEIIVWDFVEEHLHHLPIHLVKENATTAIIERSPKILFDRLIAFYVQKGLPVPIDAGKFQEGLRERFIERDGMFFTNVQVQEYDKKKAEAPTFVQLSLLVSSEQDGVYWLKNLLKEKSLTYQDIQPQWMQALAGVRKGDVIPELATILDENFLKDTEGKWYLPDPENEADLEKLRNKRLLKQFEDYKTQATATRAKKIKEVRVDALRAGFKQCYQDKDFQTIVRVGDRIPNNLLMEDEVLLQFYDIAASRV